MIAKLAWRNIWRNKRRTLITVASIAFAVFFAVFMLSLQRGAWSHMLDNVVNFYYGYAQVHQAGYWEDKSLDNAFVYDNALAEQINSVEEVNGAAPRIESFALASVGEKTTGVLLVGTEAGTENALTNLSEKIVAGSYWEQGAQGALVADGLAEKLDLALGDTIILISQGYRGANAAGKYPVTGLLHFGSPELNKRMVYLPLAKAQYFFAADGLVTTVALDIPTKEEVPDAMNALVSSLDTAAYDILGWEEMIPELVEARDLDAAGNNLVLVILYLIITFGIFGTILMMTRERQYEFGVLVGIGMKRRSLGLTVWMEIVFMGLLGAAVGLIMAFPLVYHFFLNPIDLSIMGEEAVQTYEKFGMEPVLPALVSPTIFLSQAVIVFFITTILAIYPFWRIRSLKPVEAMRD